MTTGALVFMLVAWLAVLTLTTWCFYRLLKAPPEDIKPPPPGTSL